MNPPATVAPARAGPDLTPAGLDTRAITTVRLLAAAELARPGDA